MGKCTWKTVAGFGRERMACECERGRPATNAVCGPYPGTGEPFPPSGASSTTASSSDDLPIGSYMGQAGYSCDKINFWAVTVDFAIPKSRSLKGTYKYPGRTKGGSISGSISPSGMLVAKLTGPAGDYYAGCTFRGKYANGNWQNRNFSCPKMTCYKKDQLWKGSWSASRKSGG